MKAENETVIDRQKRLAKPAICSICQQVIEHPELRGTMWRKPGVGIDISFSAAVVQMAGGIDRLLADWTQVDHSGRPVK